LVEITCDSWNADFSAKFCNKLVQQFEEADREVRETEAKKTSDWLIQQVAGVKQQAEESQRKLEAATGGNGLILSQESVGVESDRLRSLQDELVKAQADRMEKEAEAGIGMSAVAGMGPDLNESPAYQQYAMQLADLQRQVAKLIPPRTELDSEVIHLRSQIKTVQAAMVAERASNATRLKSQYDAAVHREAMVGGEYRRATASVSADLAKASEVSLLRGEVESDSQLYQKLIQTAQQAGLSSAMHASTIRVVDAAKANQLPFSPKRSNAAASGLLVGTFCGVGLAFIIERSTTVLRIPGDTERYLGLRELGVIPSAIRERKFTASIPMGSLHGAEAIPPRDNQPTLSNWTENFSIVAEAYRSTTTSIMLSEHPRGEGLIYVLSSPNPGEGKTTVISNMGVALSKSRLRVLLIDGDLRKPALHKVLQVPNGFGLRNLLRGETGLTPDSLYQSTALPNLFVLPAGQGSEETVELLHSPSTAELLRRFRCDFDIVIIDTPPMLHMADARILASHAQGVILVVRAGMTKREEATKARDLFDRDSVRMVGTILNDFNPNKSGLYDYYRSYQRYANEEPVSANATTSWLEWLFSRDPRVKRPAANNGAYAGVADAAENGANGANGAHAGGSGVVYGEVITPRSQPTFFMKVLAWSTMTDSATADAPLADSQNSLYAPITQDRRSAKRQELPVLVAYYWDGGASRAHDIRDISLSGLYLVTDVRWYLGTQVLISLQRPDVPVGEPHRSITVHAKVVRFGIDGLGFELVMPEKQAARRADGIPYRTGVFNRDVAAFGIKGADKQEVDSFLECLPKNPD
jgi:capsular exopolysaccharide synthesis family protein